MSEHARLFSVRWGDWWFMNWHLYRKGISRNKHYDRTPIQWQHWKCVFCGKEPHHIPVPSAKTGGK